MRERDLFYEGVRQRYTLYLRNKYTRSKANAKVKSEREKLSKLVKERKELLTKVYDNKASQKDLARLREVNKEINNLNQTIKNKISSEMNLVKTLNKEIKNYDNAIITLLNINQDVEVRQPVEAAIKAAEAGRVDEAAFMVKAFVQGEVAAAATGGRRGQL